MRGSAFPKINFQLMLMADAQRMAGNMDAALRFIDEAEANAVKIQERIWLSEIARTRGNILLALKQGDAAVKAFKDALDVAKRQKAALFELRAARDLARHWAEQGRDEQADGLLRPAYDKIKEGFDTPDLVEAKALLDEVS